MHRNAASPRISKSNHTSASGDADALAGKTNVDTSGADSSPAERAILKRVAIVAAIGGTLFAIARFTPMYQLWRHQQHYSEAETTVEQIRDLTAQLDNINEASVRQLLNTDEFRHLKEREAQIALRPGELVWFQVNEMITVGLRDDGGIMWMTDQERGSNH